MATPAPLEHESRLRGRSFWKLTLTAGLGVGICLIAFVVELERAVTGNGLSWIYVAEWPILGTFGAYMWWRLLHDEDGQVSRSDRVNERRQLNAASTLSSERLSTATEDPIN